MPRRPAVSQAAAGIAAIPVLELAADAKELALTKGLAVGLIGLYGRSAVRVGPAGLADGTGDDGRAAARASSSARTPRARTQAWAAVEAGKEGWIENRALSGGYLFVAVDSAEAADDDPRRDRASTSPGSTGSSAGGEKYGADYLRHPVRLNKGRNVLLFRGERGRFKGRLYEPPAEVFFTDKDMTLPDLVLGEKGRSGRDCGWSTRRGRGWRGSRSSTGQADGRKTRRSA
ncbi:MAG: hypothetical protein M0C28_46315 [Candidatus Moduliflexus flocculans]|nr:hypothetical protein [Candidatus Moduliflexus flocculans]